MNGPNAARPLSAGLPDDRSVRAEVERVISLGHFSHRALMLVIVGLQLRSRHAQHRLRPADVLAAACAGAQVGFEAVQFRAGGRSARWVPAVTMASTSAITALGRSATAHRSTGAPWEIEWGIWSPFGLRLMNVGRGWSAPLALPYIASLAKPAGALTRGRIGRHLVMLACADVFADAFGSVLRRHGDNVDRLAFELKERRADTEVERARDVLRSESLEASTERLREMKRSIEDRSPDMVERMEHEYERLRRLIVEAGRQVGTNSSSTNANDTESELERLAEETQRTLTRIGQLIPMPVGLIVSTAVATSPPRERRWLVAALLGVHGLRVGTQSRRSQSAFTSEGSTQLTTTIDVAAIAAAYHLVDLFTAGPGEPPQWAPVSVASLSLSAAATARTGPAALLPAVTYAALRLGTRRSWRRDRSTGAEMVSTVSYLGLPAWALFRIIDHSWASVRRLSEWAIDAAELAAAERLEAERRRVRVALHDHGVQTVRYVARNPHQTPERLAALIDRAIGELNSVADEVRPQRRALADGVLECAGGYRRFGLDPQVELSPGPTEAVSEEQAQVIHGTVNQGLANVLAHSSDRRPTVTVTSESHRLRVSVVNVADPDTPPAATLGFGLGQLDERVRDCGATMRLETDDGFSRLTVTLPLG